MMRFTLALLLSLLLSIVPARAGRIVLQPGFKSSLLLDDRMDMLIDRTRRMTLADALAADRTHAFRPGPGNGLALGYTHEVAWVRFRISGSHSLQRTLLWLSPAFVDLIDVYVADDRPNLSPKDFEHHLFGDNRPLPADGESGLGYGMSLDFKAGETKVVFIRVASIDSSLNLSAAIYARTRHTQHVTFTSLVSGMWFGGMTVLLAIQLVFYLFRPRSSYLLLAISTFGAVLVYMGNLGVSRLFFFPDGGIGNDLFTGSAVWFGLFASALAARSILEMPRHAPWMSKLFLAFSGVGLIGIGFALCHNALVFAAGANLLFLIAAPLTVGLSLWTINSDGNTSRLNAAAYCILTFGLLLTTLQRDALFSLPNWAAYSYAAACLVQTLLLTTALVVQLRAAETVNHVIRERALFDAQLAEQNAVAMVEERTRELVEAKGIAEDALRAELQSQARQVHFMEVISHQYRTPLAAIRSNVDAIGLSLENNDKPNHRRLERVRRGIARLVEMLEVNLSRSRLQGPSFQPRFRAAYLGDFIISVIVRTQDLIQGSRIQLEIISSAEGALVHIDFEMLSIALLNLIENAVKYSVQRGSPSVIVRCKTEGSEAVIAVIDHGIGIPAEELSAITYRFVRGSNVGQVEGSGMGLSLVARIAGVHGGRIEVESEEHQGTTVRLRLPLARHAGLLEDEDPLRTIVR